MLRSSLNARPRDSYKYRATPMTEYQPPPPLRPSASLSVVKLMMLTVTSLSAAALTCVLLQHCMLPSYDRGNPPGSATGAPSAPMDVSPTMAPGIPPDTISDAEAQEAFLELVKRRAAIQTPLDNSFWRPYTRVVAEQNGNAPQNGTRLYFVAGAEGTGHHFITALMMRLPELMPMSLVQEQMFQALWWDPTHHDPATFWGALEAFSEWVREARSLGKHPAFCARTCLRISGLKHCSWISGVSSQTSWNTLVPLVHEARMLLDASHAHITWTPPHPSTLIHTHPHPTTHSTPHHTSPHSPHPPHPTPKYIHPHPSFASIGLSTSTHHAYPCAPIHPCSPCIPVHPMHAPLHIHPPAHRWNSRLPAGCSTAAGTMAPSSP